MSAASGRDAAFTAADVDSAIGLRSYLGSGGPQTLGAALGDYGARAAADRCSGPTAKSKHQDTPPAGGGRSSGRLNGVANDQLLGSGGGAHRGHRGPTGA